MLFSCKPRSHVRGTRFDSRELFFSKILLPLSRSPLVTVFFQGPPRGFLLYVYCRDVKMKVFLARVPSGCLN